MNTFDEFSFAERDLFSLLSSPLDIPELSSPEKTSDEVVSYTTEQLLQPMISTFAKNSPQGEYTQKPIQYDSNSSSEPNTPVHTYGGNKRKEDDSAKENQREASRKYRARKKAMIEKLQEEVKTLSIEKQSALEEKEKIVEAYQALNYQNQQLRNAHTLEVFKIDKKRNELLQKLAEVVKDPKATDEEIMPHVKKLMECCRDLISIGECNWKMLISPTTAHLLQKEGFFENYTLDLDNPGDANSLRQYANRIFEFVPEISAEQKEKMNNIVEEYYEQSLAQIKEERAQVCKEIEEYFSSTSSQSKDISKAVQAIGTLELLRSNLSREASNWQTYVIKMLSVLSARQAANLYLRVEIRHRAIMQLKSMWDTLCNVIKKPNI